MCRRGACCQTPGQLKSKPQDCSPEQIKKCHGDSKKHPCVSQDEKSSPKPKGGKGSAKH